MQVTLETKNLTKAYGKFTALNNVTVKLFGGRIVGLLGPNGSGKTTLLKLIAGILTKTSGELTVNGNNIGVETKKVVSYLPERTYLAPSMKVKDCVALFKDFYQDFNAETAVEMLKDLGVPTEKRLSALSKGTREKVQLILVMSRKADVYLLDEPIGGVDPAARDYILKTIISNYNENAILIISTHLIGDIENVLDDVLMIKEGQIVLCDSVDNIRESEQKSIDGMFREVFRC